MESLHKNNQLMLEFLKSPFLVLLFSSYRLINFLIMLSVVLLSMTNSLYSKCDQASDLWQQLELPSELEYALWDAVVWSRKWLILSQLASFDRSNKIGPIDMKMDGSVLEEKSSFNMLELTFSLKLDWGSYINSIAKTEIKLQVNWSLDSFYEVFFLLRLLCISTNLPYGHAWNTVVMYGMVLLVVTLNCWMSYKNGFTGPLVLHLLPLSNPSPIVKM